MIRAKLTAVAIALLFPAAPAIAEELNASTVQAGNFTFDKPLVSMNYAQSWEKPSEYAVAISAKNPVLAANGLNQSTALLVNCKSGNYSVAFGQYLDKTVAEEVEYLVINFCNFHKETFAHNLW